MRNHGGVEKVAGIPIVEGEQGLEVGSHALDEARIGGATPEICMQHEAFHRQLRGAEQPRAFEDARRRWVGKAGFGLAAQECLGLGECGVSGDARGETGRGS